MDLGITIHTHELRDLLYEHLPHEEQKVKEFLEECSKIEANNFCEKLFNVVSEFNSEQEITQDVISGLIPYWHDVIGRLCACYEIFHENTSIEEVIRYLGNVKNDLQCEISQNMDVDVMKKAFANIILEIFVSDFEDRFDITNNSYDSESSYDEDSSDDDNQYKRHRSY